MKKKVLICVQGYRPAYEAISKEVKTLTGYLNRRGWFVKIHDVHAGRLFSLKISPQLVSYHLAWYPLTVLFFYFYSFFFSIRHIYTSLTDIPYLSLPFRSPLVLTAAAPHRKGVLEKKRRSLKKISRIVFETEEQKNLIPAYPSENKEIIYPGIDLNRFFYQEPRRETFTILFASNPKSIDKFASRGIFLLLETAKSVGTTVLFDFSWRTPNYQVIDRIIKKEQIKNITLTHTLIVDMNQRYGEIHCTIIPYTTSENTVKLLPLSAIESLAAGKPILCSSQSGIAPIIKEYNVGVVFDPESHLLVKAIRKMQKNYKSYQQHCRAVAEKLFSGEEFGRKYEKLYLTVMQEQKRSRG